MSADIKCVTDQTFDSDVLQSAVPVLVAFCAECYSTCQMIAPALENAAVRYSGCLLFAKIEVDNNPSMPARYHIRRVPTLMLFKNGKVVATECGSLSKLQLVSFIETYL